MDKFKTQLVNFIDEFQRSRISPYAQAIILYGSYARGEHNSNSDIDILIQISEAAVKDKFTKLKIRNEIANCIPYNPLAPEIDFHLVFSDDWKTNKDVFFREIRKDGYYVWKKDNTKISPIGLTLCPFEKISNGITNFQF